MSEEGKVPGKGIAIAGMVIGIVALLLAIFSIGFTLGLIGLVLSVVGLMQAKKAGKKNGMAMVGIILGVLAIALSWYMHFEIIKAAEELGNAGFKEMMNEIENSQH